MISGKVMVTVMVMVMVRTSRTDCYKAYEGEDCKANKEGKEDGTLAQCDLLCELGRDRFGM